MTIMVRDWSGKTPMQLTAIPERWVLSYVIGDLAHYRDEEGVVRYITRVRLLMPNAFYIRIDAAGERYFYEDPVAGRTKVRDPYQLNRVGFIQRRRTPRMRQLIGERS